MSICHECGGTVTTRSAAGLNWEVIPGVLMGIPEAILVPRCESCDEYSLDAEQVAQIEAALEPAAKEWVATEIGRAIKCLKERDGVTTAQLEAAAGVTHTYLSHASNLSRGRGSLTLLRLLQAFVVCPAELRRHLERRPVPPSPWWAGETDDAQTSPPRWSGRASPVTALRVKRQDVRSPSQSQLMRMAANDSIYAPPRAIASPGDGGEEAAAGIGAAGGVAA